MAETGISILVKLRDQFTGPLKGVRSGLTALLTDVQSVGARLAPLTSRAAQVIAGFAGVQAARTALQSAGEAARDEANLSRALLGRVDALKQVNALSEQIERTTAVAGSEVKKAAALYFDLGGSVEGFDAALKAAVNTAAALNVGVDAVVRDVAILQQGGESKLLAKALPQVKALQKEGASLDVILAALNARFADRAVAQASNDFGRATQETNRFGNAMEDFGRALAPAYAILRTGLADGARAFADIAARPEVSGFFKLVAASTPLVLRLAVALGAIAAASAGARFLAFLVGAAAGLVRLGATIALTLTNFTAMGAGLARLAVKFVALAAAQGLTLVQFVAINGALLLGIGLFLKLSGAGAGIAGAFSGVANVLAAAAGNAKRIFQLFSEGKITLAEVGALVRLQLDVIKASIYANIVAPLEVGLLKLKQFFLAATYQFGAADLVKAQINGVSKLADAALEVAQKKLAQALNDAGDSGIEILKRVQQETEKIRAEATAARGTLTLTEEELQKALSLSTLELGSITSRQARRLLDSVDAEVREPLEELIKRAFQDQFERGAIDAQKLDSALTAISKRAALAEASRQQQLISAQRARLAELDAQLAQIAQAQAKAQRDGAELLRTQFEVDDELLALATKERDAINSKAEATAKLVELERARVRIALELQKADIETLDRRRSLAADIVDRVEQERERLQDVAALAVDRVKSGAGSVGDAFAATSRLVEQLHARAEAARLEIAGLLDGGPEVGADVKLADLLARLDAIETKAQGVQLEFGNALVAGVQAQQAKFESVVSRARQQADEGRISSSAAAKAEAVAYRELDAAVTAALATLEKLAALSPALAAELAKTSALIVGIRERADTPPEGTFFTGLEAGIRSVTQRYDELREIGAEVGAAIGNGFLDFIDVLDKGGKAIGAFAVKFLAELGRMIVKLILFKALSSVLGFSEGGKVPSDGTPAPVERAHGGPIPGVDTGVDKVRALLRPGEFVLRPEAVREYGLQFLYALNDRLVPRRLLAGFRAAVPLPSLTGRFQTGGEVGAAPPASSQATLVANETTLARLLAGGEEAFKRALERNAGLLRTIVRAG